MNRMSKIVGIIIAVSIVLTVGAYFLIFNQGLSHSTQDWANFGGYLGGILAPIFTILNIAVFIRMTNAIDKSDETRRNKELEYQKYLILTQIRQKELNSLTDILNKALVLEANLLSSNIMTPIMNAITYIESFLRTKHSLFPIDENSELTQKMLKLHKLLVNYSKYMTDFLAINNPQALLQPQVCDYKAELLAILDSKSEVLSFIQQYIIQEIDKGRNNY
jgi:hypothetical protein